MNPQQLSGASVNPQANVYFDGKCISHSLSWPETTLPRFCCGMHYA